MDDYGECVRVAGVSATVREELEAAAEACGVPLKQAVSVLLDRAGPESAVRDFIGAGGVLSDDGAAFQVFLPAGQRAQLYAVAARLGLRKAAVPALALAQLAEAGLGYHLADALATGRARE